MPAVDTTAINAHNSAIAAYSAAMYRPLRKAGGGANDALVTAAATAAAAAIAATNAATVNPAQASAMFIAKRHYSRAIILITAPLGIRRRRAMRILRDASRSLVILHQVNI